MSRKQRIEYQLNQHLAPVFLSVEDESHRHFVPDAAETHFKVIAVSDQFKSLARVARYRLVHRLLANELETGLHALSMHLYSPEEWQANGEQVLSSPACRKGFLRHG